MKRSAVEAFQLLGIPRDSDRDTIAHAYRRLARAVHPDVSPDAAAAERFADLTEAYRIATAAPALHPVAHPGTEVSVRRPDVRHRPEPPIVAGPVRVDPSSDQRQGGRHG